MTKADKKIIVLIIFALTLPFLFSCNAKPADPAAAIAVSDKPFTVNASVKYGELETELNIQRQETGLAYVQVLKSENLNDLDYTFQDNRMAVSYMGLVFTIEPEQFPGDAVSYAILAAINAAWNPETAEVSDIGGIYLFKAAGADFELTTDSETGALLRLSCPGQKLDVTFSNFNFI
ncbi:MAG: hypothetical protein LBC56_07325 [Oscillospiraceae bacterium]|nr:hypothetical protein [Oscillospiraceae bacterium]